MKRPLTIRLDDDVRSALGRLSKLDNRSMSAMIQVLIRNEAIKRGTYVPQPLRSISQK